MGVHRCTCRYKALKIIPFYIVRTEISPCGGIQGSDLTLGRHYPDASRPRVRVAHKRINTSVVISRRSRARAVARAIQTLFFVIYDNTYAVGRITARSGRRRRSGFV